MLKIVSCHARLRSRREAKGTNGAFFSTEEQFADVIGNDNQRLIEIWNSLPGVKPVTKFANRKAATERIWKAIQNLGGPVVTKPAVPPAEGTMKLHTPTEIPPDMGSMQAAPVSESPVAGQPNVASQPKTQPDSATTPRRRTLSPCQSLGDFYELFFEDAVTAARELEITLTSRMTVNPAWRRLDSALRHGCVNQTRAARQRV